ncbi:hypothetical protein DV736_g5170, partial [Chaetothyriales sp. CBS 134916]
MLNFVLDANANFQTVSEWKQTLRQSIFVQSASFDSNMASWKALTEISLLSQPSSKWIEGLKKMNLLVKTLPKAGFVLITGATYLESLIHAYTSSESPAQTTVVEHAYHGLLSLLSPEYTQPNNLMDQLHLLKSETSQTQQSQHQQKTLWSALICETSFLRHLSTSTALNETKRGRGVINDLRVCREQSKHLHPRRKPKVSKDKGKGKATDLDEIHIHKTTSISQVHELFPHLPTAYILRLLDHFQDNTEFVIAALLEPDSLPPRLQVQDQDRTADGEISAAISAPPNLAPHSTPPLPPQRRNVFDDDDFDNLRISPRQVHHGRKAIDISRPETVEEHNRSKAAIMAALAAFDSDDDERDDTYDVADVGGSVDQSIDTDNRAPGQQNTQHDLHEESLFRAWKDTPALFARDSKTRISPTRQQLKRDLDMTDEQIEGWVIMLSKDHMRQRRLEKKYSAVAAFQGNQRLLGQTKWSGSADASAENTDDENSARGQGANDSKIRGSGSWGRGGSRRTGGAAGAGPQYAAAQSQAIKNKSEHARQHGGFRNGRGSRNTRREGRAKKMARGAFGGPPVAGS